MPAMSLISESVAENTGMNPKSADRNEKGCKDTAGYVLFLGCGCGYVVNSYVVFDSIGVGVAHNKSPESLFF